MKSLRCWSPLLWLLLGAVLAGGCDRDRAGSVQGAATEPAQAVALLTTHLRNNDLQAFARDAVPPELQPGLAAAWQQGHSRWPLDELPFDRKIPGMFAALSAPQAEKNLRRTFDWQFAHAYGEIRAAAVALSLFTVKYLQSDPALSADERHHYAQIVPALRDWAVTSRLGDPKRAHRSITQLVVAARQTGLVKETDFDRYGMNESLRRLGPFVAVSKRVLRDYGLDLDQSLDSMQVLLESQTGDTARVRMRYRLADEQIDTVVSVERVASRWYLSDYLQHARTAATTETSTKVTLPTGNTAPTQSAEGKTVNTDPTEQPAARQ